jgi:hypothetical protein
MAEDADLGRTTDFSGRRAVLDDTSLTRTRFASQEEQETCFHLIEDGWERTSFRFSQMGQAIVMTAGNSSPSGA